MRWLLFALAVCVFQAMDVGSTLSTAKAAGAGYSTARAIVDGASSAVMIIAAYPWLRRLMVWASPWDGDWLRFAASHILGLIAFAVFHVGGLLALRWLIYPVISEAFVIPSMAWAPGQLAREAATYGLIAAAIWVIMRLGNAKVSAKAVPDGPITFDIRDGARVIRTPVSEITAVRAAGNYAEFLLADGRRPLMRITMASAEAALTPHGFGRTHRAWIVNRVAIVATAPAGSGNLIITLKGGIEAPVARRVRRLAEPLTG